MNALRAIFGALVLCGCWFAMFVWVLVFTPIGIIQPQYAYTFRDVFLSVLGCGLALSGYFVWLNWLAFATSGRFFGASPVTVQAVSFFHHLAWFVFFGVANGEAPWETAAEMPLTTVWLTVNVLVALVAGLFFLTVGEPVTEPRNAADSR